MSDEKPKKHKWRKTDRQADRGRRTDRAEIGNNPFQQQRQNVIEFRETARKTRRDKAEIVN